MNQSENTKLTYSNELDEETILGSISEPNARNHIINYE
jgi:hypothetical protein